MATNGKNQDFVICPPRDIHANVLLPGQQGAKATVNNKNRKCKLRRLLLLSALANLKKKTGDAYRRSSTFLAVQPA